MVPSIQGSGFSCFPLWLHGGGDRALVCLAPRLPVSSLGCLLQGQLAVILCGNSLCGNGPCCGCVVLTKTGKFSVVLGENLFPCTIQPFKLCWHFKQPRNTPTPITLETRLCAGFPPEHGVLEAQWQHVSLHPSLVWLGSQQAVCAALNLCSAVSASSGSQDPRIPGTTAPLLLKCLGLQVEPHTLSF